MTGVIFGDQLTRTITMDSNLSDKEGYAVALDTSDDNNVDLTEDATVFPFPLNDCGDGSSSKYTGSIVYGGRAKVKLGGSVNAGDKLTATTNGVWIATTTDGDHYGAVAVTGGSSGDLCEVIVERGMVSNPGE